MARKRKTTSAARQSDGLQEAYPSSPTRPPIEVTRLWYGPDDGGGWSTPRFITPWGAEYAVAKYVQAAITHLGPPDKLGYPNVLCWPKHKLRLTTDVKPIEYYAEELQLSSKEEEWELPDQELHHFGAARRPLVARAPLGRDVSEPGEPLGKGETSRGAVKNRGPRTPRPARTEGAIGVGTLAQEAGLEPKDARKALRDAFPDRERGTPWEWAPDHPDLETVRSVLNKAAVALAKKKGK